MTYNLDFSNNISRFGFVFLIYVLVTSGYVTEILSCQVRTYIQNNWYVRHILAIILLFAFIMFEGGWDFDKERENKESNNWASGNTPHTLAIALIFYFIFLISSKSKLIPNIMFFILLFNIYIINTYREYIYVRKEIDDSTNNNILQFEQVLTFFAIIVLVFGFIQYYLYQVKEHPNDFDWFQFLIGSDKCNSGIKFTDNINTMTKSIKNMKNESQTDIFKAIENMTIAIKAMENENKDEIFKALVTMNETIKNNKKI
jgi:hypothetical protein